MVIRSRSCDSQRPFQCADKIESPQTGICPYKQTREIAARIPHKRDARCVFLCGICALCSILSVKVSLRLSRLPLLPIRFMVY